MIINNSSLDAFENDFFEAVKPLEEKYGVTISLGRITYYEEHFSCKLDVVNGREKEDVKVNEFDALVYKYSHIGLGKGMYNRIFISTSGKKFAINGFRKNARKYPIEIINVKTGEHRICNEYFIKELTDSYYTEAQTD